MLCLFCCNSLSCSSLFPFSCYMCMVSVQKTNWYAESIKPYTWHLWGELWPLCDSWMGRNPFSQMGCMKASPKGIHIRRSHEVYWYLCAVLTFADVSCIHIHATCMLYAQIYTMHKLSANIQKHRELFFASTPAVLSPYQRCSPLGSRGQLLMREPRPLPGSLSINVYMAVSD